MLQVKQLNLQLGNKVLFNGANATIFPGHKVALVGANGCGKSTLFNVIRGELGSDNEIGFPKDWRFAWVKQETPGLERSALDYVLDGHQSYRHLQQQLKQAEQDNNGELIATLHHQLEDIQAYSLPAKAGELLNGLGFTTETQQHTVSSFSGGWRMRLNLAQALIVDSDCLLLDEPTNHLDLDAVFWLEKWLNRYPGTIVLISHDRDFIDNICQGILHIEQQQINSYTGNYSSFEKQRAEKLAQQQANFQKQQTEIKHIQSFITRFKAKASKAKQAQSRVKMLERMTLIAPAHVDSQFHFEFKEPTQLPSPLIKMDKVSAGYPDHKVLSEIKLNLVPGSRIALLGRNGAGKSTFIKTLARSLAPLSGEFEHSKHLKIGYFAQHQLDTLQKGHTPVEHLFQLDQNLTEQQARDYLGGFGFHSDQALDLVDKFSGGEKARLVLALMVYQKPNLILLDEPTNHLDIEMRQALTMALQGFEGAMILISHDRHLIKACCDDLYLVADGQVAPFNGDLDDYHAWLVSEQTPTANVPASDKQHSAQAKKDAKRRQAQMRQQISPLKKKNQQIEQQQHKLNNQLQDIETQMSDSSLYEASNKAKLNELLNQQGQIKSTLEELDMEWLSNEEEIEAIEQQFQDD